MFLSLVFEFMKLGVLECKTQMAMPVTKMSEDYIRKCCKFQSEMFMFYV